MDVVDIFDASTGARTVTALSEPRYGLAAVAHLGAVYFAGGIPIGLSAISDRVDIYDEATGTWSTETLPVPTSQLGAAALNGQIYFGPGFTPGAAGRLVQVYDTQSRSWSVINLPGLDRAFGNVITDGRYMTFACGSGVGPDHYIDIYDSATGSWTHTLSPNESECVAGVLHGKVYLTSCDLTPSGRAMHVLDIETMAWSRMRPPLHLCLPEIAILDPFVILGAGADFTAAVPSWSTASLYNTWTKEWRTFPLSITARVRDGVANEEQGKAYFAGGTTIPGGTIGYFSDVDILSVERNIGTSYCGPAHVNSTGRAATLHAVGFRSVAENFLTLAAHDAPVGQLGLFLVGTQPASVAAPSGVMGTLCVGGATGRLLTHVATVNAEGILAATIDLDDLPLAPGGRPAQVGETLYFQAAFRDVDPLPTIHLSDARAVTFAP